MGQRGESTTYTRTHHHEVRCERAQATDQRIADLVAALDAAELEIDRAVPGTCEILGPCRRTARSSDMQRDQLRATRGCECHGMHESCVVVIAEIRSQRDQPAPRASKRSAIHAVTIRACTRSRETIRNAPSNAARSRDAVAIAASPPHTARRRPRCRRWSDRRARLPLIVSAKSRPRKLCVATRDVCVQPRLGSTCLYYSPTRSEQP